MTVEKLALKPTSAEKSSYRFRRVLMKTAAFPGVHGLGQALIKIGSRIENFHRLAAQQGSLFDAKGKDLKRGPESASSFESGFGYEDEFVELKAAAYYRAQIEAGNLDRQKTESGALYREVIESLSSRLRKGDIKTVLNFGVSYAHVDTQLAAAFPDVRFVGLERSKLTTTYNQNIFGDLPNVSFVASDVFDHLKANRYDDALFLHIRTLTLLPESFVDKLYGAAAEAGFADIAGFEQCGISYETHEPYAFDLDPEKPSVNYRSGMFIHNYPGKAAKHGFDLRYAKLLKTNHPESTYRIACFRSSKTADG